MELRVIPYSSNSAYQNMAIDHALLESVAMGKDNGIYSIIIPQGMRGYIIVEAQDEI